MQIVIDISNELYSHIQNDDEYYLEDGEELYNIVKDGTPLSKGHGRLIDADAFAEKLHEISECHNYKELTMNVDDVFEAVIADLKGTALNGFENNPTIIEADRGE